MKLRRTIAILGASVALLAMGAQPMLAAGGLRAGVNPAASGSFGAKLDGDAFPNNAYSGQECPDPGACTRVMNRAYGDGKTAAPRNGYVDRIDLVGGVSGSFRLFFVKVDPVTKKAKAVKKGPFISYQGQPATAGAPTTIESFEFPDTYVKAGWRIAIKSAVTSVLSCQSGNGSYTYQPGLKIGEGYRAMSDNSSCELLVQVFYR